MQATPIGPKVWWTAEPDRLHLSEMTMFWEASEQTQNNMISDKIQAIRLSSPPTLWVMRAAHPPAIRMADCWGLEQLLYHLLPLT